MSGDNYKLEALERRQLLTAVFTVTNTADSGDGSLRQAITDANATPIPQSATILFDIPGSGVQTIKPLSELPDITVQIDIQGTTDASGNPLIQLDGESAGNATGLVLNRNTPGNIKPSIVTGLIINRFSQFGIDIDGNPSTDVYGCRIGTDATGAKAMGNGIGVELDSPGNQIGMPGSGPAFQTVISGNVSDGIDIENTNNIIQNCFIGTDASGNKALGNGTNGIECIDGQNLIGGDRAGEGNVITANHQNGVAMDEPGTLDVDNLLIRNKIGTNAAGTAALGNTLDGVLIANISGDGDQVGDRSQADENLISGNGGDGVEVLDAANSQIFGNLIGSDISGKKSLGNALDGVHVDDSTEIFLDQNVILGSGHVGVRLLDSSSCSVDDATIGGSHGDGVLIQQITAAAAHNNEMDDDHIGVDDQGTTSLADDVSIPNGGNGVEIIGASITDFQNSQIYNNRLAGVEISGASAVGNVMSECEMFNNGKLGISLGTNIGTDHPNLPANASGAGLPNDGINHPLLSSAVVAGGFTNIATTLVETPNTTFDVEYYSSPSADPSGFGQGQLFLGDMNATTDANGNASVTAHFDTRLTAGEIVTAFVFNSSTGDASEFSNAVKATGASVSGSVFNDVNGNGKQDAGEKGLAKQLIFVDLKGTGIFDDDFDPATTTNSNGNFTLFGVPSGAIHLDLMAASGFTQTLPSATRPFYKLTIAPLSHTGGIIFGEEKAKAAAPAVVTADASDADDRKLDLLDALLSPQKD
jgi:hypothetical protein